MRHARRANGELLMSEIPPFDHNPSLPAYDFDRPATPTTPPSPAFGQQPVSTQRTVFTKAKKPTGCLGFVLGFGILIGGCIAFAGFQTTSSIRDVRADGHAFLDAAIDGDTTEAQSRSIRGADCVDGAAYQAVVDRLDGVVERELSEIDVVTFSGDDSSFGWGDVEQLRLDFPDQSVARASGAILFNDQTSQEIELVLLRPASQWRVCQVSFG